MNHRVYDCVARYNRFEVTTLYVYTIILGGGRLSDSGCMSQTVICTWIGLVASL